MFTNRHYNYGTNKTFTDTYLLSGRLYNDLGLIFTQCHNFTNAAHCFEQAVSVFHGTSQGSKEEAVVLQNLGAVYNSLGAYDKALKLHESAASLHG